MYEGFTGGTEVQVCRDILASRAVYFRFRVWGLGFIRFRVRFLSCFTAWFRILDPTGDSTSEGLVVSIFFSIIPVFPQYNPYITPIYPNISAT